MKKIQGSVSLLLALIMLLCAASCAKKDEKVSDPTDGTLISDMDSSDKTDEKKPAKTDGTVIELSDDGITVGGVEISGSDQDAVYASNDIVYYESGRDFTYGEGGEDDEHSAEEAAAHTVVHITQPGAYTISGKLSRGLIAVDLGVGAKDDPAAVVTVILNNADITCTVAPALIFYRVYECGDDADPTKDVDTSAAGANVIIADNTVNTINGSYVARIYKSVTLSEDGTSVVSSKKLHKYDGALYSKMSMNIGGNGVLNVNAENEGIDSEMHLTINGGNINISAGNDGINTNEDGVSVTTINGGSLHIRVNGTTGEGDGIDSNGWIVINGGTVVSEACSFSADSGLDADMGIYINGGTVVASGNMYDAISDGGANYAVFSFRSRDNGGKTYALKNAGGETIIECAPENSFTYLVLSSPNLTEGEYTVECDGERLLVTSGTQMGGFGGFIGFGGSGAGMGKPIDLIPSDGSEEMRPKPPDAEIIMPPTPPDEMMTDRPAPQDGNMTDRPDNMPSDFVPPSDNLVKDGEMPPMPEKDGDFEFVEGLQMPGRGKMPDGFGEVSSEVSEIFKITNGGNFFTVTGEVA